MSKIDFDLYLITDRNRTAGRDLPAVVAQALQGGLKAVQLREKDMPEGEYIELAMEIQNLARRHGAKFFINSRVDLAFLLEADGVHLGKESVSVGEARLMLGPERTIGYSAHGLEEAIRAEADGADFVTFGPVYFTPSKAAFGEPVGCAALKAVADRLGIPVFGLGGINLGNAGEVMSAGAKGIALISAITAAPDPEKQTRQLLRAIKENVIQF